MCNNIYIDLLPGDELTDYIETKLIPQKQTKHGGALHFFIDLFQYACTCSIFLGSFDGQENLSRVLISKKYVMLTLNDKFDFVSTSSKLHQEARRRGGGFV